MGHQQNGNCNPLRKVIQHGWKMLMVDHGYLLIFHYWELVIYWKIGVLRLSLRFGTETFTELLAFRFIHWKKYPGVSIIMHCHIISLTNGLITCSISFDLAFLRSKVEPKPVRSRPHQPPSIPNPLADILIQRGFVHGDMSPEKHHRQQFESAWGCVAADPGWSTQPWWIMMNPLIFFDPFFLVDPGLIFRVDLPDPQPDPSASLGIPRMAFTSVTISVWPSSPSASAEGSCRRRRGPARRRSMLFLGRRVSPGWVP